MRTAPAWHPAAPVYRQPAPMYRQTPSHAQQGAWRGNPYEARRRHDDAFRLVQERQRNAVLAAQLAAQQGTATAQAAAAAAQQQLVAAQAQLATAQAALPPAVTAPAQSPVVVQPSMPAPQPDVSPGNAVQDMGPTQDAAAAVSPDAHADMAHGEEHPGHAMGRKIVIGLVVVGLGVGGYMFMKSRKKGGGSSSGKPHAATTHGFGRSRRRRGRR